MKSADYKCTHCSHIKTIYVQDLEPFPIRIECPICWADCHRYYTPLHKICHQGKCGNSKTGYTSNQVKIKKT
jgi:hypothetical protein